MEEHLRIRWRKSTTTAHLDSIVLHQWEKRQITTSEAAQLIGRNNGIECTEEMLIANARELGYRRDARFDSITGRWIEKNTDEYHLLERMVNY